MTRVYSLYHWHHTYELNWLARRSSVSPCSTPRSVSHFFSTCDTHLYGHSRLICLLDLQFSLSHLVSLFFDTIFQIRLLHISHTRSSRLLQSISRTSQSSYTPSMKSRRMNPTPRVVIVDDSSISLNIVENVFFLVYSWSRVHYDWLFFFFSMQRIELIHRYYCFARSRVDHDYNLLILFRGSSLTSSTSLSLKHSWDSSTHRSTSTLSSWQQGNLTVRMSFCISDVVSSPSCLCIYYTFLFSLIISTLFRFWYSYIIFNLRLI